MRRALAGRARRSDVVIRGSVNVARDDAEQVRLRRREQRLSALQATRPRVGGIRPSFEKKRYCPSIVSGLITV